MSKSDDLEDFCIDLDEIEVEEESLVQIRKQLLLTQQFRIDQERKNATISSLKRRIESLEDEKSASYAEVGELRIKLRDKETIESKLSSITIELEESTDKYACLLLENENLREEMKSLQNRYHIVELLHLVFYLFLFLGLTIVVLISVHIFVCRYDKLKISHYKSQERENELSINIASLEKYINELRSDISKKDKEYLHHEKQVTIHLEKLDNEKLSQQQRVTFLEEEVEAQLATIKDYENGNRNLELSLKHAESVRVALKDELQEQQEEIEAYAEKNAQLETVLNSIRHELSSLASAHKHEMHAMQVRIDQCNNDYMDQKNETAKYKMMLGSIGTAVEKHYEYDDMVQQRSDKSDSRTSHHDGDGNRYVPYSTIMSQSNENKQSSYRRNEPVDAKYEEMMRKTVRNYEKNSNINQSTKKLNEDQEVAAMVCKLLSENHHVKQENIVLTNKLNSCFEDINRKQSHIQRIELEHNWLLNSMEELDDVIYDFEKRLSNDDVVYIQMHAMSGNGNSANVSFNQDNEEQQGIHTAENMEPQSETLEKESFIGTNGKKINKKHASNTHKKHYATSTISSQHMFPNSSSVHPTSNNPNGANTNRSKSPNIVESNHATNRSRSNSMEKSTATGTSKHAPTSTETHEINYSNISDSNLAKIVQHRKNRIQILQEAYNKLVNCCESFIVSENEKAEEISNLEEQLQSQSKLQLLLVKKQENDVSDLKLKYEETIREWTAKYYQQIDAMSEANEHAEMAVRTVTEEAQIEMEFLTKKFKENMGETNTYLEQEHVKEINALKKKHVTHVEDICSILIYVLFCYMKLYANYYEVVIQKSIYFQMSRRYIYVYIFKWLMLHEIDHILTVYCCFVDRINIFMKSMNYINGSLGMPLLRMPKLIVICM